MKENTKINGKKQKESRKFGVWSIYVLIFVVLIATSLIVASFNTMQIKYGALQKNYTDLVQLQDLHANTTLLSQYISINAAKNMSYCIPYGCTNYTQAGNYTFNFNINGTGYLKIATTAPQNISVVEWETYNATLYNIPQNRMQIPAAPYLNTYPDTVAFSVLNKTTTPIAFPVIPGNLTLKLYNYGTTNYYGKISITYVR